jgi:putative CocE/NonD family hydrolase
MKKYLFLLLWFAILPAGAADFDFRAPTTTEGAAAAAAIADLAARLIPVYQDPDADRYLANLSALQLAAGNYAAADISRQTLRERRRRLDFGRPAGQSVVYDMFAHAKAVEAENRFTFSEAFTKTFRETIPRLSDSDAYLVAQSLHAPPAAYREALQKSLEQRQAQDSIDESAAVELIWKYVAFDAYRSFGALVILLESEDERRRYASDNEVTIHTSDGAVISAIFVRPKTPAKPVPTLLEFTNDDSLNYARECAAHGYAGVVAYSRGTHKSSEAGAPFDHDGDDARAVIDWIAKQAWSDGRVGMYGQGFSGFAAWAAAKRPPPELKAMATSAVTAPGINFPMEGSIFRNSAYRWSLRMTDGIDQEEFNDDAPWQALDQKWYRSGRRYRDLGRIYGKPNPIFIRWLNHPSYDGYWRQMLPDGKEFAQISIPVLTVTGYYAAAEPGDLYLFTQHLRYNQKASATLLIGPYDDDLMRRVPSATLHTYDLDTAALVDLRELRYQWFDHVLKGGAAPALLKDTVNYELMGANGWQHAATIDGMAGKPMRFFLQGALNGANHHLTPRPKTNGVIFQQSVSFKERQDAAWTPSTDLINRSLAPRHGALFVSDPLPKPIEFSGLFSGRLDFTVNKMDMDLTITLYELLANGDYVRLFSPTYEFRASYVRDRVHRHLLKAGERQELAFKSERLTSRQLQKGSRLVMVLGISKRPDREINYGTGGDVSEESIADGRTPLKMFLFGDSYLDIPARSPAR